MEEVVKVEAHPKNQIKGNPTYPTDSKSTRRARACQSEAGWATFLM